MFQPNYEICPVNKTIKDAISIFKKQAKLQGIGIKFIGINSEIKAKIDYLRTQQVIINLVSNAIKFAPAGSSIIVKVSLSLLPFENKQIVSIEVSDKGIGINEIDLKNLFSPFFKTSDSMSREKNKQSHGLGLSISKMIAEKL